MSDLRKVKEINVVDDMAYANKHLANGWVLIAVNSVQVTDHSGVSGISTEYVLGWEDALPAKWVSQDKADTASKYAPKYDCVDQPKAEKPKPQPKRITISDF